jgi:hypothetical protein
MLWTHMVVCKEDVKMTKLPHRASEALPQQEGRPDVEKPSFFSYKSDQKLAPD